MRTIINETGEQQIQSDENGREYVYRKDFIAGGDGKQEFSLSLVYSRPGRIVKMEGTTKEEVYSHTPVGERSRTTMPALV